jgi:hypothetical protein
MPRQANKRWGLYFESMSHEYGDHYLRCEVLLVFIEQMNLSNGKLKKFNKPPLFMARNQSA